MVDIKIHVLPVGLVVRDEFLVGESAEPVHGHPEEEFGRELARPVRALSKSPSFA